MVTVRSFLSFNLTTLM